ncbi:MAG: diaminopimelate epimerase [Candidatus Omnitrophota bacterium]
MKKKKKIGKKKAAKKKIKLRRKPVIKAKRIMRKKRKPIKKKPAKKMKAKPVKVKAAGQKKAKQIKQKTKPAKKRKIEFTKMVASGNDFIVYDNRAGVFKDGSDLAVRLCKRTEGIGADGLIFIERSKKADFKMRIFNPDGSEAEMCGNGIRCAAFYKGKKNSTVVTLAGILKAELKEEAVKIKMTPPKNLQLNMNLDINGKIYQVNFVNTGVPHAVYFVEDLDGVNVKLLGRLVRYYRDFQPEGTNVDFVKIEELDSLKIRTYERGVEDETLACGTGSVAAALIYHQKFLQSEGNFVIEIHPSSGEMLKIYFDYQNNEYTNIWMEGKARIVYKGECYV